jgi:hypothetical protein
MKHRNAATLVEVLVAIFVMAIGLLALLTLFPLGALRMAQAIKDDRTAHAAANANAIAEARAIRQTPTTANFTDPGGVPNLTTLTNYAGASYPVYVDPFGRLQGSTHVANVSNGILRINSTFTLTAALAYRWFTLLDDLNFDANGVPALSGTQIQRTNRYSWAYLLRRPRYSEAAVVDLTVVVYSGRNYSAVLGETAYTGVRFDPNSKVVQVTPAVGQGQPAVRKGSWVLDATMVNGTQPDPHGFFYRVSDVTESVVAGRTVYDFELQTYPRLGTISGPTTGYGVLVVPENVVEVFEKGPGWKP